jgi:hypothetical protein
MEILNFLQPEKARYHSSNRNGLKGKKSKPKRHFSTHFGMNILLKNSKYLSVDFLARIAE